jgi:nucleotide-binding universal stress UspA family protein
VYSVVLVALDGSQAAAAAIPPAIELAQAFMARLVLLRVLPLPQDAAGVLGRDYSARLFQAESYLESLKRSLQARGVNIEAVIHSGDPASVILGTAHALDRSLLVITSHGTTPHYSDKRLGRVAEEVLQRAEGPVVLVRPQSDLQDVRAKR